ncbi:MAG: hypothetical protein ACI92S_001054 [Planctomycetaceae bacterium]|jgi:hypothetical protein
MSVQSFVVRVFVAGFMATLTTISVAGDAVEFLLPKENSAFEAVSDRASKLDDDGFQFWTTGFVTGDVETSERLLEPIAVQRRNDADFIVRLDVTRDGLVQGFSVYETRGGGLLADQAVSDGRPDSTVTAVGRLLQTQIASYRESPSAIRRISIGDVQLDNLPPAGRRILAVFLELLERRLCDSPRLMVMSQSAEFWKSESAAKRKKPQVSPDEIFDLRVSWSDCWTSCEITAVVREASRSDGSIQVRADELSGTAANQLATAIWAQQNLPGPVPEHQDESARHLIVAKSLWQQGLKDRALESAELAAMTAPEDADSVMWLSDRMREATDGLPWKQLQGEERTTADRLMIRMIQATCNIARLMSVENRPALVELQQRHGISLRVRGMFDLLRSVEPRLSPSHRERLVARGRGFTQRLVDVARDLTRSSLAAEDAGAIFQNVQLYGQVLWGSKFDVGNRARRESRLRTDAADATLRWLQDLEEVPQELQLWSFYNVVLGDFTQFGWDDPDTLKVLDALDQHSEPLVQLSAKRARLVIRWKAKELDLRTRADEFSEICDDALAIVDSELKKSRGTRKSQAAVDFLDRSFNYLILRGGEPMALLMMATAEALMERRELPGNYSRMALDGASAAVRHADADTGLQTGRRVSEFLTEFVAYRRKQTGGGAASDSATHKVDQIRLRLETKWPDLADEASPSAVAVRQLYHAPGSRFSQWMITNPFVRDEIVYTVAISPAGQGSQIQLVAIPLDGEPSNALGAVTTPTRYRYQYQLYRTYVTATGTDAGACYVAVSGMGVFRYELDNASVSRIVSPELLSDGDVQSLAIGDGHLYAGIQGGKLLRGALAAEPRDAILSVDTLVSTSRSDIESPLDRYSAFGIPHLLFDSARKRLLIVIQRERNDGGQLELWEHSFTGETSLVHALVRPQRRQTFARLDGDILKLADVWIARWNLATDKADILANYPLGSLQPTRRLWVPYTSEPVVCAGHVWWIQQGGTLGRYEFPSGQPRFQQIPEFAVGKPFDSGDESRLSPIDDKRFLAYYAQRLWLVTPLPSEVSTELVPDR